MLMSLMKDIAFLGFKDSVAECACEAVSKVVFIRRSI